MQKSALDKLKDDELCLVTIKGNEFEVRWNLQARQFCLSNHGTNVAIPFEKIEEWRPASVKF